MRLDLIAVLFIVSDPHTNLPSQNDNRIPEDYKKTAALTSSLLERIGGDSNYDYRCPGP